MQILAHAFVKWSVEERRMSESAFGIRRCSRWFDISACVRVNVFAAANVIDARLTFVAGHD